MVKKTVLDNGVVFLGKETSTTPAVPGAVAAPGDLKAVERALIVKAMDDAHFNKSEAAKALGLTRAQLYVRLRKHGLDRDVPKSR